MLKIIKLNVKAKGSLFCIEMRDFEYRVRNESILQLSKQTVF